MTSAIIAIAAAAAIAISTIAPANAQGLTAKSAMESIARQPDAAKEIRSTLIIALALMEALTIYGLLIAFHVGFQGIIHEHSSVGSPVDDHLLCPAYAYPA